MIIWGHYHKNIKQLPIDLGIICKKGHTPLQTWLAEYVKHVYHIRDDSNSYVGVFGYCTKCRLYYEFQDSGLNIALLDYANGKISSDEILIQAKKLKDIIIKSEKETDAKDDDDFIRFIKIMSIVIIFIIGLVLFRFLI